MGWNTTEKSIISLMSLEIGKSCHRFVPHFGQRPLSNTISKYGPKLTIKLPSNGDPTKAAPIIIGSATFLMPLNILKRDPDCSAGC